ncbi:MAG: hypothetical protein FWG93_00110 [Oscillospiraceae bacterium]|nr:hypothetical protein [Oscillospiraceae bacterium]
MGLTEEQKRRWAELEERFIARKKAALEEQYQNDKTGPRYGKSHIAKQPFKDGVTIHPEDYGLMQSFAEASEDAQDKIERLNRGLFAQPERYTEHHLRRGFVLKNAFGRLGQMTDARLRTEFIDDLKQNYRQYEKEIGIQTFVDEREFFKAMDLLKDVYKHERDTAEKLLKEDIEALRAYPASFEKAPGSLSVRLPNYHRETDPRAAFNEAAAAFQQTLREHGDITACNKHNDYCARVFDENLGFLRHLGQDMNQAYTRIWIGGKSLRALADESIGSRAECKDSGGNPIGVLTTREIWMKNKLAEALMNNPQDVCVTLQGQEKTRLTVVRNEFDVTAREPDRLGTVFDYLAYYLDYGLEKLRGLAGTVSEFLGIKSSLTADELTLEGGERPRARTVTANTGPDAPSREKDAPVMEAPVQPKPKKK